MPLMNVEKENIVLFHPHVPSNAKKYINETLDSRWIGQGPKVKKFEELFSKKFCDGNESVAVGSGTDAMHLAYKLLDIKEGDEVIVPVFTCTATNIPLLYERAKIVFADVQQDTLNISVEHVKQLINEKTKAVVCVHYGGLPCDMDELKNITKQYNIPIVEDAAHALGASYKGQPVGALSDFTMFSFQAIKHITTGDGGMLSIKDSDLRSKAERIRWFGIDRTAKQQGHWDNDITELGYKYQMTDIAAAMGLAALEEFDATIKLRKELLEQYRNELKDINGIKCVGTEYVDREHAAWLCTVLVENRMDLQRKLYENHVESNQVHYRNDRYTIFGGRRNDLPNMDLLEDHYLVLPLHTHMNTEDVSQVCDIIKSGW